MYVIDCAHAAITKVFYLTVLIVNSWHSHSSITSNGNTNQNFLNGQTKRSTFWGWCHRRWLHICGWCCWTVVSRCAWRCWAVVSRSGYCAVVSRSGHCAVVSRSGSDCDSHRGNSRGGCGFNATRSSWHCSRCSCNTVAWCRYLCGWWSISSGWRTCAGLSSMHCKIIRLKQNTTLTIIVKRT